MSIRSFLLYVIPILGTLLIIESAFRFGGLWVRIDESAFNHFTKPQIPDVPFLYQPGLSKRWSGISIKTNSIGLKDPWEPDQYSKDCHRILILGGSFAAGFGVDFEKSFPRQLEILLNQRESKCYQVFNASVVGFSTQDIVALGKYLVPKINPDLVLHFVNRFSFNNTSKISKEGTLSSTDITFDWLRLFWKMNGGEFNKKKSTPSVQDRTSLVLDSHALTYLGKKLSRWWDTKQHCDPQDCFDTTMRYTLKSNDKDRFLSFSPIYYSPFHQKRLYQQLNSEITYLKEQNTPLVLIMIDFFLNQDLLSSQPEAILDLSEILDMKNDRYFSTFNLVWDFHFTPYGHKLIAEGLHRLIKSSHFSMNSPYSYDENSSAKEQVVKKYREHINSSVDFVTATNMHQVIGGLKPQRMHDTKEVSILLKKNGPSTFRWTGKARSGRIPKFRVQLTDENHQEVTFLAEFSKGRFDVKFPLKLADGMISARIICQWESCDSTEYDFVGLE